MRRPPQRAISLTAQLLHLQAAFPNGTGGISRGALVWEQSITPHALSATYCCRIGYKVHGYPEIYCENPPLSEIAKGRVLPHVYRSKEPVKLCLFMHNRECWSDSMLLSKIVIPLVFYWLAHFEHWLFTGEWVGEGTHPVSVRPPKDIPEIRRLKAE